MLFEEVDISVDLTFIQIRQVVDLIFQTVDFVIKTVDFVKSFVSNIGQFNKNRY